MLTWLMVAISLYLLMKLYISVMQIGYVNTTKRQKPVLMGTAEFMKAANYSVAKEKLAMVNAMVEYLLFIVWIGGGIAWLDSQTYFESELQKSIVMVVGFILINGVITMPLEWYGKFVLDQKFGFNRSTVGLYIKDTLIGTILTIVFGSLVVWGIYAIISSFTMWWLWSFLFIFAVIILINMLFPTVRAMFFDKLSPLEDKELDAQINTLMEKTGFESSGVFVSDASKRDARLNAYFGGLGKTKRVVLFDTLLQKLTNQELLAVLGHELGHFAHGDIYKNIGIVGGMLFMMFAIFGNLPSGFFMALGLPETPAVLMILFILFMPLISFVVMPLMGIISRHNEYEADRAGAELGGGMFLAEALKKLVTENKSYPLSHPLYIFFYYTHPPVMERLKALGYDENVDASAGLEGPCPTQDL
jgi:STE24 endopeptidase